MTTPTSKCPSNPTSSCPPTRWPPSGRPACWVRCTSSSIRRSASAQRATGARRHDSVGQIVDISVDRGDTVVAFGGDQFRRPGSNRRHRPQLQYRILRQRERRPRIAYATRRFRRRLRSTSASRIIASIDALNRLAGTFASQRDVISQALQKIPPALDVLIRERPRITAALEKLRVFSDTASRLINDTQADLVKNLQNLEPTISRAGRRRDRISAPFCGYLPTFPVHPELHRPGNPGRLFQRFRGRRFDSAPAQENAACSAPAGAIRTRHSCPPRAIPHT